MLDPSNSKQRNTLVDLVWLLISLYFLFSITGFRPIACQPIRPANLHDADPAQVQERMNAFEVPDPHKDKK